MKHKLKSWLDVYKEKVGKSYDGSNHPNPKSTSPQLLNFVANIKVAKATICRNEILEEIKNNGILSEENVAPLKREVNYLEDEIALWRAYV
ncbi:MAG TPA: hypothetical protein DE312_13215 [Gallionella sp.]|nr:MAG: hypothetical protein A2Z87_08410 [Gallionellales bacterium GWA2_54_124]OGT17867.1 MAG: hypothetical protein A2522_06325 [Gallionellales bacterium RIFOXYD12_FULL_53_10]HCI54255.1 hypothetical protein [Gallionella sp.]